MNNTRRVVLPLEGERITSPASVRSEIPLSQGSEGATAGACGAVVASDMVDYKGTRLRSAATGPGMRGLGRPRMTELLRPTFRERFQDNFRR